MPVPVCPHLRVNLQPIPRWFAFPYLDYKAG
jgi:hypothetical protein